MQSTASIVAWLELLTAAELADLSIAIDWTTVHLDWSERPRVATFLTTLDALVVAEQRRRNDPATDLSVAALSLTVAVAALEKGDLQLLLRSWRRMALNREKDASEPVARLHVAVGDLLLAELAARLGR